MRKLVVALSLFLSACGPGVDFTGKWSGNLSGPIVCSDGSTGTRTFPLQLVATQEEGEVSFAGNTSCGVITGKVSGDTASLNTIMCAPIQSGSVRYVDSLVGGKMEMGEDSIDVSASMNTLVTAPVTATCTGTAKGTLSKL